MVTDTRFIILITVHGQGLNVGLQQADFSFISLLNRMTKRRLQTL